MSYKRIVIADRSLLAHNVYQTLFKPLGYTLFPYQTLQQLKAHFQPGWGMDLLLVNSNTFGKYFSHHLEWLQREKNFRSVAKIFLCDRGEKEISEKLKRLPKSRVMMKPFSPPELEKKIDGCL